MFQWMADSNVTAVLAIIDPEKLIQQQLMQYFIQHANNPNNIKIKYGDQPLPLVDFIKESLKYIDFIGNPKKYPHLGQVAFILNRPVHSQKVIQEALQWMQAWIKTECDLECLHDQQRIQHFYTLIHAHAELIKYKNMLVAINLKTKESVAELEKTCQQYYIEWKSASDILLPPEVLQQFSDLQTLIIKGKQSSLYEKIENFFGLWFAAINDHALDDTKALYAFFLDESIQEKIIATDEIIKTFEVTTIQEKGFFYLELYEINRILLTALIKKPREWTPLFARYFQELLQAMKNIFNEPERQSARETKEHSYPPSLINQLNYYLDCYHERETQRPGVHDMRLLHPERIQNVPEWTWLAYAMDENQVEHYYQYLSSRIHALLIQSIIRADKQAEEIVNKEKQLEYLANYVHWLGRTLYSIPDSDYPLLLAQPKIAEFLIKVVNDPPLFKNFLELLPESKYKPLIKVVNILPLPLPDTNKQRYLEQLWTIKNFLHMKYGKMPFSIPRIHRDAYNTLSTPEVQKIILEEDTLLLREKAEVIDNKTVFINADFEICCVFLQANIIKPENWEPQFAALVQELLEAHAFDDFSTIIHQQLEYLLNCYHKHSNNPRPKRMFLLPNQIETPEEWLEISEVLDDRNKKTYYQLHEDKLQVNDSKLFGFILSYLPFSCYLYFLRKHKNKPFLNNVEDIATLFATVKNRYKCHYFLSLWSLSSLSSLINSAGITQIPENNPFWDACWDFLESDKRISPVFKKKLTQALWGDKLHSTITIKFFRWLKDNDLHSKLISMHSKDQKKYLFENQDQVFLFITTLDDLISTFQYFLPHGWYECKNFCDLFFNSLKEDQVHLFQDNEIGKKLKNVIPDMDWDEVDNKTQIQLELRQLLQVPLVLISRNEINKIKEKTKVDTSEASSDNNTSHNFHKPASEIAYRAAILAKTDAERYFILFDYVNDPLNAKDSFRNELIKHYGKEVFIMRLPIEFRAKENIVTPFSPK